MKAALAVVWPVPPLAMATVPVTFAALPEMLPVTCEPGKLNALRVVSVELLVAVILAAVPVVFWLNVGQVNVPVLKSPEAGVPSTGVTKVGDVDNTLEPEPVEVVTPVPPLATGKVPLTPAVSETVLLDQRLVPELYVIVWPVTGEEIATSWISSSS